MLPPPEGAAGSVGAGPPIPKTLQAGERSAHVETEPRRPTEAGRASGQSHHTYLPGIPPVVTPDPRKLPISGRLCGWLTGTNAVTWLLPGNHGEDGEEEVVAGRMELGCSGDGVSDGMRGTSGVTCCGSPAQGSPTPIPAISSWGQATPLPALFHAELLPEERKSLEPSSKQQA